MAVKILIQRKVKPGKEKELNEAVRELRSKAIHAEGYIFGETLCSIEEPSVHLVISTWKSLEDWNHWAESPGRKVFQQKTDAMLEEPTQLSISLSGALRSANKRLKEGYKDMMAGIERKPYPSLDGLRNIQRLMKTRNPKVADSKVEDLIDSSFVRRLDQSGFFDQLYSLYGIQ